MWGSVPLGSDSVQVESVWVLETLSDARLYEPTSSLRLRFVQGFFHRGLPIKATPLGPLRKSASRNGL